MNAGEKKEHQKIPNKALTTSRKEGEKLKASIKAIQRPE